MSKPISERRLPRASGTDHEVAVGELIDRVIDRLGRELRRMAWQIVADIVEAERDRRVRGRFATEVRGR